MEKATLKNKLIGIILIATGGVTAIVTNDITAFCFIGIIGVALLISKKNYIM